MATGGAVAAARIRAEREIVAALREAGATSPLHAAPLAVPARWVKRRALDRMVRRKIVHEVGARYWLDEAAWAAHDQARRRTLAVLVVMTGALVAIVAAVTAARGG